MFILTLIKMQKALFIKINPKIDVDDLGGAVITWQDKRNSTDYDITPNA